MKHVVPGCHRAHPAASVGSRVRAADPQQSWRLARGADLPPVHRTLALSNPRRGFTWLFLLCLLPAEASLHPVSAELSAEHRLAGDGQPTPGTSATAETRAVERSAFSSDRRKSQLADTTKLAAAGDLLVRNTSPGEQQPQVANRRSAVASENQSLREDQVTLRNQLAELQARLTAAHGAQQQVVSAIAALRNLIPRRQTLEERHQALLSRLVTLERDVELLQVENSARRNELRRNWTLLGITVLFGGLLAGLAVTRIRW